MKRISSTMLMIVLLLSVFQGRTALANSAVDDLMYQIVYNAAVKAAEEAGYKNYEIIIDDDYNATINVMEESKSTEAITEDEARHKEDNPEENEQVDSSEKDNVEENIASKTEELDLGMQELKEKHIIDAMRHFLRALPNEEAERMVAEHSKDYVDVLMLADEYEAAQSFMLEHPFEGNEQMLAECNDHCVLIDLARGLEARWKISNQDASTWSDKKVREWYQQLVECESQYLDKYLSLSFTDTQLADYVRAYIGGLQRQTIGAAYYGIDNKKYNENWIDYGASVRSRMIYLINRKYGIELDSSYSRTLKEVVDEGRNLDYVYAVTESLRTQLSTLKLSFRDTKGGHILLAPFVLRNTSGYDIGSVDIDVVLLDEKENVVDRTFQLFHLQTVRDGEEFLWRVRDGYSLSDHFSSLYYEIEITDLNYQSHYVIIHSLDHYAWDGKEIMIDERSASNMNRETIVLEETQAFWLARNDCFIPCVEFILRNDGETDLEEITIEYVFIDKGSGKEWSRDKYFAITSSDEPLQADQKRSIMVCSKTVYKVNESVPDLVAEVYINNKALARVDVSKP